MSIVKRARADIRSLKPYQSARKEAPMAEVMLNANESPWSLLEHEGLSLNRYPEPQPHALRKAMSQYYSVQPEQILMTRGSDEAIDLLVRAFCEARKDALIECPPCFGMYRIAASIQGIEAIQVPLLAEQGFELDLDGILSVIDERVKLVFICSPNNPTGNLLDRASVIALVEALKDKALIVIDEAYIEYANAQSYSGLIDKYSNISILRTLSKAFSTAGGRVGALLAPVDVVELLSRIIPPYPLPLPSTNAAERALNEASRKQLLKRVGQVVDLRERVRQQLSANTLVEKVWPSEANYLLIRMRDAQKLVSRLKNSGILIRDVGHYPGLQNCVRISIGTEAEMTALFDELERFDGR